MKIKVWQVPSPTSLLAGKAALGFYYCRNKAVVGTVPASIVRSLYLRYIVPPPGLLTTHLNLTASCRLPGVGLNISFLFLGHFSEMTVLTSIFIRPRILVIPFSLPKQKRTGFV